jgi:cell division transport system permease protein
VNFRSAEYLLQEAFTGIKRNGVMAYASISTVALSLAVLGAFVLAALGANNFAASQIKRFQIAVFMSRDATFDDASKLSQKIVNITGVGNVSIRSRDKEWADFKRKHPNIESAGLPLNVLPYALDVKISKPDRISIIAGSIRQMNKVDGVLEGRKTAMRVMAVARVVRAVSTIGVLLLLITTAFIISNAIRLTLYARRREIRIMQLVGATDQFIRIPLVIEGIVFGATGAIVAWLLLRAGAIYVAHTAQKIMVLLGQVSSNVGPTELAVGLVLTGAIIGAAGSLLSMRRFLRDG